MKKFLVDLKPGENVEEFFLVKTIQIKVANNGNQFADLVIADKTGEVTAKIWDLSKEELVDTVKSIQDRDVVKIRGSVIEWNGMKQVKIFLIRKTKEDDSIDPGDYIKVAPLDTRKMYQDISDQIMGFVDEELKAITGSIWKEYEEKLLYFPAAMKNHHAIMGGLLYHVYRMLQNAGGLCDVYPILNQDLLKCGIILHDIAKLQEIDADQMGMADQYTFEGQMLGHIIQGIKIIDQVALKCDISSEKRIMIEHMILSHHYEAEFGSPKKPLFPEAEMLHYLDMIDARIYDMEEALKNTEPGTFSERVWTMDQRKLYKSHEDAE